VAAESDSGVDVVVFMECVINAIGVTRPVDLENLLAREGVLRSSEARKVYRWRKGENAPSFYATMRLLRRAGFLTPEALECFDGVDRLDESTT
jgi:hypothetical protein